MASRVFRPVGPNRPHASIRGSRAVFSASASVSMTGPGAMTPPRKAPSRSRRSNVVADFGTEVRHENRRSVTVRGPAEIREPVRAECLRPRVVERHPQVETAPHLEHVSGQAAQFAPPGRRGGRHHRAENRAPDGAPARQARESRADGRRPAPGRGRAAVRDPAPPARQSHRHRCVPDVHEHQQGSRHAPTSRAGRTGAESNRQRRIPGRDPPRAPNASGSPARWRPRRSPPRRPRSPA